MKNAYFFFVFFIASKLVGYSQCWDKIAAGGYTNYAIKSDGTLWAWGNNFYGQLGDNTNQDRIVITQVGTDTDWATIDSQVGGSHVVALKTDGSLWTWGVNFDGQLGDGSQSHQNHPINVAAVDTWKSCTPGGNFTLGIKQSGRLYGWGAHGSGQLANNSQYTSEPNIISIGVDTDWKSVHPGFTHSLALKNNGTLWCWGDSYAGALGLGELQSNVNTELQLGTSTWAKVDGGYSYTLGIKTDGTLWAWGLNDHGQLGDGTNTNKNVPVQIGTSNNWVEIDAGFNRSFAIKADGTLWGWGLNDYGQLGDNTIISKNFPVQIGIGDFWTAISGGREHTIGLKNDNTLWVWGRNGQGVFGNGLEDYAVHFDFSQISCTPIVLAATEQRMESKFSIYPVPATDRITIDNKSNLTIEKMVIVDVTGKIIVEQMYREKDVDVSKFSVGLYFVKIYTENKVFEKKFIKQ